MPTPHFYFAVLGAFIIAFATGMMAALAQVRGTTTRLDRYSWLAAILGGLVAAAERGREIWPG